MSSILDVERSIGAEALTSARPQHPRSFGEWRRSVTNAGLLPVVAVAGSRGKSTVVRLLQAVADEAGLRTALWTDQGVEIERRRQRGELLPWRRALERLSDGTLDLAIQELDWSTLHAVGLPRDAYPVVTVTNLCGNNDSCLVHEQTRVAVAGLGRIRSSVHPAGMSVLNGEDFSVAADPEPSGASRVLFGLSRDTPLIRRHLLAGGTAAWLDRDALWVGTADSCDVVVSLDHLQVSLNGLVGFQIMNALAAVAVAYGCGIPVGTIGRALAGRPPEPESMPGSFNVLPVHGATVIVDRPAHPWFLRSALRAVGHVPGGRLLRVIGQLEGIATEDLVETGRLLGRGGGALLLHSEEGNPERTALLRQGIAINEVPPLVIHSTGERAAVSALLRMIRPSDVAFILADRPLQVVRAMERAQHLPASA